ncbi:hypothetical protein AAG906_005842 [Vitis piasezkii]
MEDLLYVKDYYLPVFASEKPKIKLMQNGIYFIGSGASIHVTPWKDFFTSYTSGYFGSVKMGNDGSAKAIGIRYVRLETSNGIMLILKNVKHIPDIRMNLISTAKGKKCYSLYLMQARVIDSSINAVDDDSTVELWHNRLGHMSEKDLMILAKKNLLSSMKKGSLKMCAHCLAGKKIWVYTLKTKDQVLEVFKQFHAFVERQSGEKLKCIRTNNGGEYYGPFDEYCRQHGIRHQKTPPKTPQLNGLAERMNKTLVERMDDYVHKQSPYEEAMGDENKIKWVDAMQDEMNSLHENISYELIKLPNEKEVHSKKGIDFDEIFSPVVKMSFIRVVLGLAASLDLEIEQMDVKTTFLHGDLDKEIYMEQPEGFIIKGKEDYVCKLKKSLYGLKQAPR